MENPVKSTLVTCLLVLSRLRNPAVQKFLLHYYKIITILLLLSVTHTAVKAQQVEDYAIHANIIYHFTKYINWPDDKKNGDFIIGIAGNTPLFDKLQAFIANKTVGNQKIIIKKFPAKSTSFNCHILFVGDEESDQFKKIAASAQGTPTLLVTESEGLARKGSCINFVIVHERLKLEINKKTIEQHRLGIATELLNLGIPVN